MFKDDGSPWTGGGRPIVDWHLLGATTWTGRRLFDRCEDCGTVMTTDDLAR